VPRQKGKKAAATKKKQKQPARLEFDFSGDTREGERPWDFSWALQNTLEKNYDVPTSSPPPLRALSLVCTLLACACVPCVYARRAFVDAVTALTHKLQEQTSIDYKIRKQLESRRKRGIVDDDIEDDEGNVEEEEVEQPKKKKNKKSNNKKKAAKEAEKDDEEDDGEAEEDAENEDHIKEVSHKPTKKQLKEVCTTRRLLMIVDLLSPSQITHIRCSRRRHRPSLRSQRPKAIRPTASWYRPDRPQPQSGSLGRR
jgi:hypothetical protein